mmetsp:Transcript_36409/g.66695  ORF Transcript_36409/g.66695 Transcript_36409/m.66695 type:complete len:303 (-) Transcript_36409:33-941(-)
MLNSFPWPRGAQSSALSADLRRVTDGGFADIPKDAVKYVVACANTLENRKEIMVHLQECLADLGHWRRVFGALELVEPLFVETNRELLTETFEGKHFDIVQRLTFLEHFDYPKDMRVQKMVRTKATNLRTQVIRLMGSAEDSEIPADSSTAATKASGAQATGSKQKEQRRRNVMEDSTDSEQEEKAPQKKVASPQHSSAAPQRAPVAEPAREQPRQKPKKVDYAARKKDVMADSTDSSDDDRPAKPKEKKEAPASTVTESKAAPPPMVDLLDMDFGNNGKHSGAPAVSAPVTGAPEVNLLDM